MFDRYVRFRLLVVPVIFLFGVSTGAIAQEKLVPPPPTPDSSKDGPTDKAKLPLSYSDLPESAIQERIGVYRSWIDMDDFRSKKSGLIALGMLRLPPAKGVPLYATILDDKTLIKDVRLIGDILSALESYGQAAKSIAPKLLSIYDDPKTDRTTAQSVVRTLFKIDPDHSRMMSLLLANIDSTAGNVFHTTYVLDAIGSLGQRARAALPALERYLRYRNTEVAFHAYAARGRILNVPEPTIQDLKKDLLLDWTSKDAGFSVLRHLQRQGTDASFAVPRLIEGLSQEPPRYYQAMIIQTIGMIRPSDSKTVHVLLESLVEEDAFYQDVVKIALKEQVRSKQEVLVPVLAQGLRYPVGRIKEEAAIRLLEYGRSGKGALPAVIESLKAANERTSEVLVVRLLDILRALQSDGGPAADALVGLLPERAALFKGRNAASVHSLRTYMLVTLADIGGSSKAMPFILDGLINNEPGDFHTFAAAARAAGAIGPAAKETVPGLLRALKSDFFDGPVTFREFLGHLDPDGKYTSASLEAIRALARIGPGASDAVPLLEKLTMQKVAPDDDSLTTTAQEAISALKAIRGR